MAEQENFSAIEEINNPDPSIREDHIEGRNEGPKSLAQATVADRDFIASISAPIFENIAPQLTKHVDTNNVTSATTVGFSAKQIKRIPEYLLIKRVWLKL